MQDRFFGEISGYPVGSIFESRKDVSRAQVHKPLQAGISGSEQDGADSIVLSGGYDDVDNGDQIIYTGHGGFKEKSNIQISDQELNRQNMALVVSRDNGYPIRVVRGFGLKSEYAPKSGYRYDGLYLITDFWKEKNGEFSVYKYLLTKAPNNIFNNTIDEEADLVSRDEDVPLAPRRAQYISSRIVRDTKQSIKVKKLYDFHCQICGIKLEGKSGAYAEGAHIQPLGSPHNGPDVSSNILCLCPNHHVLFDMGVFSIAQDLKLIGLEGTLKVVGDHKIDKECLLYREKHYV